MNKKLSEFISVESADKVGGAITKDDKITNTIIPDNISECAFGLVREPGEPCSSAETVGKMAKMLKKPVDNPSVLRDPKIRKEILEESKKITKCDTERCILESDEFIKEAGRTGIETELLNKFKISGPTDTSLLNDKNIDITLKQWEMRFNDPEEIRRMQEHINSLRGKYPIQRISRFYAFNFNMRNFEEYGDSLATVDIADLYRSGYRSFGCVINTDVYSGRGIHWMALFGDMRDVSGSGKWTVEFYNSSGNPPQREFADWLLKTRDRMNDIIAENKGKPGIPDSAEIIIATKKAHQFSKTECGVYALYYIWARLNGIPYTYFAENDIPDILCFELRQHLFHDDRREPMKEFDYKKFYGNSQVKWERDAPKEKIQQYIVESVKKLEKKRDISGGSAGESSIPANRMRYVDICRAEVVSLINIMSKYYNTVISSGKIVYTGPGLAGIFPKILKLLKIPVEKSTFFANIDELRKHSRDLRDENITLIISSGGFRGDKKSLKNLMEKQKNIIAVIQPELSVIDYSPEIYGDNNYICGEMCYLPWGNCEYVRLTVWKYNADRICEYSEYKKFNRNRFWDSHKDKYGLAGRIPGFDSCGDCHNEEQSIILLINNVLKQTPSAELVTSVSRAIDGISGGSGLLSPPHGIYKGMSGIEKYAKIVDNYPYFAGEIPLNPIFPSFSGKTNIYLVRHAQTDNNLNNIIQGTIVSPPINATGIKQAEKTGEMLSNVHFDAMYTSPMLRCIQTITIISGKTNLSGKPPIISKKLEDLCMGSLEGMSYPEAEALIESKYGYTLNDIRRMPDQREKRILEDMESYEQYYNRLVSAIQEIIQENIGKTVLICTHARLSLFRDFISGDYYKEEKVDNASYSHIIYTGDETQVYNPDKYIVAEWNVH